MRTEAEAKMWGSELGKMQAFQLGSTPAPRHRAWPGDGSPQCKSQSCEGIRWWCHLSAASRHAKLDPVADSPFPHTISKGHPRMLAVPALGPWCC